MANFDNGFCAATVEGEAGNSVFGFARLSVTLPLDNLPDEDDVFAARACACLSCPTFLGLKRYARCNDWAQADISIEAFLDNL